MTQTASTARFFTLEEANATLPLVRAITSDLVSLSREVLERKQRLELLTTERDATWGDSGSDPYWDELRQVAEDLDKETLRLREYVAELEQLGLEVRDPVQGLVEFPAWVGRDRAFFCWSLGEAEVLHWRSAGDRKSRRRSITTPSATNTGPVDASDGPPSPRPGLPNS
jgi:hypothetical protein